MIANNKSGYSIELQGNVELDIKLCKLSIFNPEVSIFNPAVSISNPAGCDSALTITIIHYFRLELPPLVSPQYKEWKEGYLDTQLDNRWFISLWVKDQPRWVSGVARNLGETRAFETNLDIYIYVCVCLVALCLNRELTKSDVWAHYGFSLNKIEFGSLGWKWASILNGPSGVVRTPERSAGETKSL